jgi:adenylosuccinate lyase
MHERYRNPEITQIWSDEHKLSLWQRSELAMVEARRRLHFVSSEIYQEVVSFLEKNEIDIAWWKKRDQEIHHDLNAFLDERARFLPPDLQPCFHKKMTSYDTEEPAFATMLRKSYDLVVLVCKVFEKVLIGQALAHRHTLMLGKTHGQAAELQTFGKRCLTHLASFLVSTEALEKASSVLKYSKMSGAIGNYGSIDPALEEEALAILGFKPFYGATQIMPRELYAPLAQALCQIVLTLSKIALDIRLGARSPRPIYQEPFKKKQKGSSAMPHKRNTIRTEQMDGMADLAVGYFLAIQKSIVTWEERSIEQSCKERVAWPDLFHTVLHCLKTMTGVVEKLQIYPDNMLWEILESRGCYASSEAKDIVQELGAPLGLTREEAYRIVQLAAFNIHEPTRSVREFRRFVPNSLEQAGKQLDAYESPANEKWNNLRRYIARGDLRCSEELDATEEQVERWNGILHQIFSNQEILSRWFRIFEPVNLLANEDILYKKILGYIPGKGAVQP